MQLKILTALTLLTTLYLATPAKAENLEHIQQLIETGQCQGCDLSRAGLVYGNLSAADLSSSDLSEANLSRANLSNANLSQANLTGAVLFSANLSGADLSGADLRGADLRDAYLVGINLEGANLEGANLLGAVGIPADLFTAEDLYRWGLTEAQRGNFRGAIDYYSQSLSLEPDFAHAYLARSYSRLRLRDAAGALEDAEQAEQLYIVQGNQEGQQVSAQFGEGIQVAQEAASRGSRGGGGNFFRFLGSLSGLALRFLLP